MINNNRERIVVAYHLRHVSSKPYFKPNVLIIIFLKDSVKIGHNTMYVTFIGKSFQKRLP